MSETCEVKSVFLQSSVYKRHQQIKLTETGVTELPKSAKNCPQNGTGAKPAGSITFIPYKMRSHINVLMLTMAKTTFTSFCTNFLEKIVF